MAYFYGTTRGNKGIATRCSSKSSGLTSTADSWSIGGRVHVFHQEHLKRDVVQFFLTKGSDTASKFIVSFYIDDDGKFQVLETRFPELVI